MARAFTPTAIFAWWANGRTGMLCTDTHTHTHTYSLLACSFCVCWFVSIFRLGLSFAFSLTFCLFACLSVCRDVRSADDAVALKVDTGVPIILRKLRRHTRSVHCYCIRAHAFTAVVWLLCM